MMIRVVALGFCGALLMAQDSVYGSFYDGSEGNVFRKEPNSFLVRMTAERKPGKALDVGMGQGRNANYLASRGWSVTGFDPSKVGVDIAKKEAIARGLTLNAIVTTSEQFDWGKNQWDLIVITYVGMRNVVDRIFESLRPGGLVLVESFHSDTAFLRVLGPERWASNELPAIFSKFRLIHYEDIMDGQDWGIQYGARNRLVRMLAQKPEAPPDHCEFDGKAYSFGQRAGRSGEVPLVCNPGGWAFDRR